MILHLLVLLLAGAILGYGLTPLIRLIKLIQDESEVHLSDGESGNETDFYVAD
jgi:hypothetical protein